MESLTQSNAGYAEAVAEACTSFHHLEAEYLNDQNSIKEWVKMQQKIIDTVDRLEKKLNSIHLGANYARAAGAAIGIAGGITGLVGIVCTLLGHENAATLLNKGSGISLLGNATSASATLLELGLTKKVINEIQSELKRHQELTESLSHLIRRSHTLNWVLVKIFGCSIESDNIKTVIALCSECVTLIRIGNREVGHLIQDIGNGKHVDCNNVLSVMDHVGEKVMNFLRIIKDHPELREPLYKICNMLQENPLVFEFSKLCLKVYLDVKSATSYDIVSALMSTINMDAPKASTGVLVTRGAFEAIKITADVLSIIFTAKDIREGKSKYAMQLQELKVALSIELNTVLNNYPDLYTNEPTVNDT